MTVTSMPTPILAHARRPVAELFNAPPRPQCGFCGHVSVPGDIVNEGKSSPFGWMDPSCDLPDRCSNQRKGLARTEPTIIRVAVKHFQCDCCSARIRNGVQRLFVLGDKVEHGDHRDCGPGCKVRSRAVVA